MFSNRSKEGGRREGGERKEEELKERGKEEMKIKNVQEPGDKNQIII